MLVFAILAQLTASLPSRDIDGSPPASITARGAGRPVAVPVVRLDGGSAIRADEIVPALGGRLSRVDDGRFTVALPGVTFDVRDGLPFVGTGAGAVPLVAVPRVVAGVLVLPLQFVTELIPRFATGYNYDPAHAEIRLFQQPVVVAAASTAASPGRSAPRRPGSAPRSGAIRSHERRVVIVDAGHGGPDNGMHGPINGRFTIYEKDITLAVAHKVADVLRERGITVIMTRTTDTLIALSDRGHIANRNKGDLFLSIHVNAANLNWRDPGSARGYETYFLAEAKTEDARRVERMENEAVRFETNAEGQKGDPLSFIINDMAQNEHLRESSDLAETIQRALGRMHPGPSRGVKQAGFRVLVTAYMPAVLVEIGFGTNRAEAGWMADASRQDTIASAIADGAVEYLQHYERRVGGPTP